MKKITPALVLGACLVLGDAAQGATYFLRAAKTTKTMPDGRQVEMWGFAQEGSFGSATGIVQVPGPMLVVPPFDTKLRVTISNSLPVPVSLVIPNLFNTEFRSNGIIRYGLQKHSRFTDADGRSRARSFAYETPPGNTVPHEYIWHSPPAGTYIYHSGSHPALQVQMGLYGAAVKRPDTSGNFAYPGVPYDTEVPVVYSVIDPDLHDAVATGNYGPGKAMTSTIESKPHYYLINGAPFTGTSWLPALKTETGKNVLLRLINAGMDTHVPVLAGNELTLIAEDARRYPYAQVSSTVTLPALKTMDALWQPSVGGVFPLYDRRFGLVNGADADGNPIPGGMLTYVAAGKTYLNSTPITIPSGFGQASPYPSAITVSDSGTVNTLTVTLRNVSHGWARFLDIALEAPNGQRVWLTSDAGDLWSNINLTFDDNAAEPVVSGRGLQNASFTFKPTNISDYYDPFTGLSTSLSSLQGAPINGAWKLYVFSDGGSISGGTIAAGWSLAITPEP